MSPFYLPTRQEITLVLFFLTTFILFYNLETSLRYFGLDADSPGLLIGRLGLDGQSLELGEDGRKPAPWRDELENEIFGEWAWEKGRVASIGKGKEKTQEKGGGNRAMWIGSEQIAALQKAEIFGDVGASDGLSKWGETTSSTQLVKHAPGYTIIDNVFMHGGTVYIVTDAPTSFPSLTHIASSSKNPEEPPSQDDWQIISRDDAKEKFGGYGGVIHGVTWLSMDASPSNYTLFNLWRAYSSLDSNISLSGETQLPPPRRLIFPHIPTFMGERPNRDGPIIERQRSPAGFHPFLAKAVFPTLGMMYKEDWADYALIGVPFMFKRMVVLDRGAAARSPHESSYPFIGDSASVNWWEPIRRQLIGYLDVQDEVQSFWRWRQRTVVTYISCQERGSGLRLRDDVHQNLVKALLRMPYDYGYEVNIVSSEDSWSERMSIIAKSTVILGVHGDHMADSTFIRPSSHSTLAVLFPSGTFVQDEASVARALGLRYVALWNDRKFTLDDLPYVVQPNDQHEILVDAGAIILAIRQQIDRSS